MLPAHAPDGFRVLDDVFRRSEDARFRLEGTIPTFAAAEHGHR
jgi:hypothetical protein